LKEYTYFILARKIAFNSRQNGSRKIGKESDNIKQIFSKQKTFQDAAAQNTDRSLDAGGDTQRITGSLKK